MLCLQQLFDGTYLITCLIYNKFMLHFTGYFLVGFHFNTLPFSLLFFKFVVIAIAPMAIEINVAAVVGEAVEEGVVVVEAVVGIGVTAVVGFELLGMPFVHWPGLLL